MSLPPGRLAAVLSFLLLVSLPGCGESDPVALRLAARTHYTANVTGYDPSQEDRTLVELEVKAGMGPRLDTLTVTIRQHRPDGSIIREDRAPLDISGMDATGVLRVYARVPAAGETVDGLSSYVEVSPPASVYDQFPEIVEVLGR